MTDMTGDKDDSKTPMRDYIVLVLDDNNDTTWVELGKGQGVNPQQAIMAVVAALPDVAGEGTFVAVPLCSWAPITRKVQQITKQITKASWS